MLGLSFGEIVLLLGATAALVGPKDLPRIARVAGRLAGRSIGYIQLARGQFDNVMQQSQARQVHKELQDTIAQLEAIRHEIRTISFVNPGPLTRRLVDDISQKRVESKENQETEQPKTKDQPATRTGEDGIPAASDFSDLHTQATAYARLAESTSFNSGSSSSKVINELTDEIGLFTVLPVSAENAGLLPSRGDYAKGSDIVLEAILEAEVARNAKDFFAQPQNYVKSE